MHGRCKCNFPRCFKTGWLNLQREVRAYEELTISISLEGLNIHEALHATLDQSLAPGIYPLPR